MRYLLDEPVVLYDNFVEVDVSELFHDYRSMMPLLIYKLKGEPNWVLPCAGKYLYLYGCTVDDIKDLINNVLNFNVIFTDKEFEYKMHHFKRKVLLKRLKDE